MSPRITAPLIRTPVYEVATAAGPIFVKNEAAQVTGAFKWRGVRAYMLQDPGRGPVVTASTGNHGAAVATMARRCERRAVIFVPEGTPRTKTERIAAQGAELVAVAGDYTTCAAQAQAWANEHDATYVPSFDHPIIIGGHCSLFDEAKEQIGQVFHTVCVPVGGGGLLTSGVMSFDPTHTRVIGVELHGADAMRQSLAAGRRLFIDVPRGVAEGLCVSQVGDIPFRVASWAGIEVQTVTIAEIEAAVFDLWHTLGIRTEMAGAAAFAVAKRLPADAAPVLCVVSGGNIDDVLFNDLCLGTKVAA